jgi:CBS domain-containing protein
MTERLWQRGLEVRHIYEYNPLRQVRVGAIMSRTVRSIDAETTVLEVYRRLQHPDDPLFPYKRFPVVRAGRVIGMLDRERIFQTMLTEGHPEAPVGDIADPSYPTISPDRTGYEAWAQMTLRRTPYLLVVDPSGRPAGILSRSDLMATHRHGVEDQFLLEEGDWQFFFRRRRAARDLLLHSADTAPDAGPKSPSSGSPPDRAPGEGAP